MLIAQDIEDFRESIPSLFSEDSWERTSNQYVHVPTAEVINAVVDQGFKVVDASESRCRIEGKRPYVRHMVRLVPDNYFVDRGGELVTAHQVSVGDHIPQLIIVNSHDGSASFQFRLGIWRRVCSNGLILPKYEVGADRIKHIGHDVIERVRENVKHVNDKLYTLTNVANRWSEIELDLEERYEFADRALELRYQGREAPIQPAQLLGPRRWHDDSRDLWSVYNVIQENLMKGKIQGAKGPKRIRTTRAINSVNEELRVNEGLFEIAKSYA